MERINGNNEAIQVRKGLEQNIYRSVLRGKRQAMVHHVLERGCVQVMKELQSFWLGKPTKVGVLEDKLWLAVN